MFAQLVRVAEYWEIPYHRLYYLKRTNQVTWRYIQRGRQRIIEIDLYTVVPLIKRWEP